MNEETKDRRDKVIKTTEGNSNELDGWPQWKRDINLTDASTFTVNTSSGNDDSSPSESKD